MRQEKGRKRRQTRERRRSGDSPAAIAKLVPPPGTVARKRAPNDGPLPSMTARVTGLMIAVVTLVLAVLMVYGSLTGDASGIDGAARIIGGALLIVIAVVVGVLSAVPGQVRDWFARGG